MIFIRVDLPAPFSPSTAWICPGATVRFTPSLALTAGHCLPMPISSSRGGGTMGCLRCTGSVAPALVLGASGHQGGDQVPLVAEHHPCEQALVQVACQRVARRCHRADRPVPQRDVGETARLEATDLALEAQRARRAER